MTRICRKPSGCRGTHEVCRRSQRIRSFALTSLADSKSRHSLADRWDDGSRGFQPTIRRPKKGSVAERRLTSGAAVGPPEPAASIVAARRIAVRAVVLWLKPTTTFNGRSATSSWLEFPKAVKRSQTWNSFDGGWHSGYQPASAEPLRVLPSESWLLAHGRGSLR